ncbi:hypothetical protein [Methanolobus sp. ZRKC5]|uniref:hypothetical protein n=1 Tax=unclassified Methanolobus TaxID=2629569 RepID=UPI00313E3943
MTEDVRTKLRQKLVEKKSIPDNILADLDELKVTLNKEGLGIVDDERNAEIKKAFSSIQKRAQKKY